MTYQIYIRFLTVMKTKEYKEKAEITLENFDRIVKFLCVNHIKVKGCILFDKRVKKLREQLFLVKESE